MLKGVILDVPKKLKAKQRLARAHSVAQVRREGTDREDMEGMMARMWR